MGDIYFTHLTNQKITGAIYYVYFRNKKIPDAIYYSIFTTFYVGAIYKHPILCI